MRNALTYLETKRCRSKNESNALICKQRSDQVILNLCDIYLQNIKMKD